MHTVDGPEATKDAEHARLAAAVRADNQQVVAQWYFKAQGLEQHVAIR